MAIFNPSVDGYAYLVWKVQKQGRRAATFFIDKQSIVSPNELYCLSSVAQAQKN